MKINTNAISNDPEVKEALKNIRNEYKFKPATLIQFINNVYHKGYICGVIQDVVKEDVPNDLDNDVLGALGTKMAILDVCNLKTNKSGYSKI